MPLPDVIATHRLRLVLVTPEEARAALAGGRADGWHADYPREDDLAAFSMLREPTPWGPRHIVRGWDGLVCGSIGFHGPPQDQSGVLEAEIGYGLVEEARGHGLATEAVTALVALVDGEGVRVRAGVTPENAASIRVLAKCGFTDLRGSDGEGNLVMVRPLPT